MSDTFADSEDFSENIYEVGAGMPRDYTSQPSCFCQVRGSPRSGLRFRPHQHERHLFIKQARILKIDREMFE